jgi:glycosyltransferase involved in cell wall biosynthesis
MVKRIKIALNYSYDENWIGGTYYIENLIFALNALKDEEKPQLFIIADEIAYQKLIEKILYPFISLHRTYDDRNIVLKFLNKISQKYFNSSSFEKKTSVDALFPYSFPVSYLESKKDIFWIPDFQEHFYPMFFSKEELKKRKDWQNTIINSENFLILSSQNSFSNYKEIYPNSKLKPFILPFAVTLPDLSSVNFRQIKIEFNLKNVYFICPNQFWIHKGHITLINAIAILKQKGIEITVYLTGKTEDFRFPGYYSELEELINNLSLKENIISLGFLDRKVQLLILKNALAVIQPSFFEGWSTVVEDSKALNKLVIASDIEVHKEQLQDMDAVYFENRNPNSLAYKIENYIEIIKSKDLNYDYKKDVIAFGANFLDFVKK